MRVYDTEIKVKVEGGSFEIFEYHDEGKGWRNPSRWHARIVLAQDGMLRSAININRKKQMDLFKELEKLGDVIEAAKTAVLDAATVS